MEIRYYLFQNRFVFLNKMEMNEWEKDGLNYPLYWAKSNKAYLVLHVKYAQK